MPKERGRWPANLSGSEEALLSLTAQQKSGEGGEKTKEDPYIKIESRSIRVENVYLLHPFGKSFIFKINIFFPEMLCSNCFITGKKKIFKNRFINHGIPFFMNKLNSFFFSL